MQYHLVPPNCLAKLYIEHSIPSIFAPDATAHHDSTKADHESRGDVGELLDEFLITYTASYQTSLPDDCVSRGGASYVLPDSVLVASSIDSIR